MTEFPAVTLGIGIVGIAIGIVVSNRRALRLEGPSDGAGAVDPFVSLNEWNQRTYAFGFAIGSKLWTVTMDSETALALAS